MNSKLFAFRVAKPMDNQTEEEATPMYDPQSQTVVWQGGDRPLAVTCTSYIGSTRGATYCNNNGGRYCTLRGSGGPIFCDS
jgi:hypothetical protein